MIDISDLILIGEIEVVLQQLPFGGGGGWCDGRTWLAKEILELLECGQEHFEFIIGLGPGDGLMFEDSLYYVAGFLTIVRIVETGDPL